MQITPQRKKILPLILLLPVLYFFANYGPLENRSFEDGPYISIHDGYLLEETIQSGSLYQRKLPIDRYPLRFDNEETFYQGVAKVAALSDVHGQYQIFITLLKNNKIIDAQNQWMFGEGHLVITGDIFDRGPDVIKALWFVFQLEQQARQAGGKVHYLLGNHEYMVLRGDNRYLNEKYRRTENIMKKGYLNLIGKNTVLGRWLRSKATIIKINDTIYVHGGLSPEFLATPIELDQVNQQYRESIDLGRTEIKNTPHLSTLYDKNSPIWYRGYIKELLSQAAVEMMLQRLEAKHMVMGHTSLDQVSKLYQGRIFAIDSSIKKGEQGSLLLQDQHTFYRGDYLGKLTRL